MNRRELDLTNLDAVLIEVQRLHQNGYEQAGSWDLATACRHLCIPMQQCIDGFTFNPPWPIRLLGRLIFKRSVLAKRKIKPGIKAPPGFVSKESGEEHQAILELTSAVTRLKNHPGPFHPHPIFGPLDVDQWHQFHTIHCAHHLSFLIPKPPA